MNDGRDNPLPATAKRNRRTFWLIALVTVAPVVASYTAYYLFPRDRQVNSGELLATRPAPAVAGLAGDGKPFDLASLRGKWVLAAASPAPCDARCERALYATRQARTIQGREMDRVVRVWFVTGDAPPSPTVLEQHPGLVVAHVAPDALAAWPAGAERIYLIDPLGNLVLAYSRDPDIKGMARDLTRLLKASRIG